MARSTKPKTTNASETKRAKPAVNAAKKVPAPRKTTPSEVRKNIAAAVQSGVKATPAPRVVTDAVPSLADPAIKKKELIDAVVERSGIKKKDAKPVIEAMLAVLGKTLAEGREMNLQPLGKIKVNRSKEVQGGTVLIAKVRQSNRVIESAVEAPVKKRAAVKKPTSM